MSIICSDVTTDYLDTGDKDIAEKQGKSNEKIRPLLDERKLGARPLGEDGNAQLWITKNRIIVSYQERGLVVDQNGVIIAGQTHLTATPSALRICGFWVFNDELLTTLPSTTYTPIPVLVYKESPYIKYAKTLTDYLKDFTK
jgi:hypothetical protein